MLENDLFNHKRKMFEKRFLESNAFLDNVLRNLPGVGVAYMIGKELKYLKINETLARWNGQSVESHIGKTLLEMVPAAKERVYPDLQEVLATGKSMHCAEFSIPLPAGTMYLMDYFFPIRNEREIVGAGAVVIDITERKRFSESLIEISESFDSPQTENFFNTMTKNLASYFGVQDAFISKLSESKEWQLTTISYWNGKGFMPEFDYDIKGTPCEQVHDKKDWCFYPSHVQKNFSFRRFSEKIRHRKLYGLPVLSK